MDCYKNRTKDILENLDIPISTGRPSVRANGGTVENSGTEFYLNVRWINRSDFTFSTSANVGMNKNIIVRSEHDFKSYQEAIDGKALQGGIVNVIGEETGAIFGWKLAGVNPLNGSPQYYLTPGGKRAYAQLLDRWDNMSVNEQEVYLAGGSITSLDAVPDYVTYDGRSIAISPSMQYLGRSNPKYVGGFSTYLRYKNIEFTTQWSYKVGNIIESFNDVQNAPNNSSQAADGYSSDLSVSGTNRERRYLNFWKMPGDVTDIPGFVGSGRDYWAGMHTSAKYEKGDYLRLSNISVSYRLPSEVVKRFGMQNMSLAFNAYNLFTSTKYKGLDVGTGGAFSYPTAREYNVKLSIGF